jgi:O-antigen/teichoic acid export membrane protein
MGRLRHLIGDTLVRNSFALMLTTAVTSVFGLVFWAVAARRYETAILGRTTSLVAAATLVAVIGQLNLSTVLGRFLPTAAEKSRRLVRSCYISSVVLVAILIAIFLAADIGHRYLQDQTSYELLFAVAAILLTVQAIQDAVLVSLRRSSVVLAENFGIATARLILVVVLAPYLRTTGVAVASVLPAAVASPIVAGYLYRRLLPKHEAASDVPSTLPGRRRLAYFVGAAAVRSVVSTGTTLCIPLLVTAILGLRATAYFTVPWLINTSVGLFLANVSLSYIVQARFDRKASRETLRRAMLIGLWVVVISTLAETFIAPLMLQLLGASFASHGTTLMRLLGIATPFSAPVSIYVTFNSLDQRVWRLVLLEVAYAILLLGSAPTLLRHYGVSGIGWAYLVAQALFGLGSIRPANRYLRNHQRLSDSEVATEMVGLLTT